MITATGNNFGAYTIQLKDYQSDKMVILNGRFDSSLFFIENGAR